MQKLVWKNSLGDEIDLTGGNYGITEWEGFSNTSLNIQSQQVPFQDGGVFLDALMEQRELSVTLKMQDNGNLQERYRMRRELVHILNPKLGEGYLIYTNNFISKRIKCVAQIPLFETHNSDTVGTPKASLSWTACEPYWEDLEEKDVVFKFGQIATIDNNGDIPAQMKIDLITENASNPSIININDNKFIKYNGQLNKNLYIDTNIGQKKVYTEDIVFDKILSNGAKIDGICYSEKCGLFVAVGGGIIYTSYEGEEWEERSNGQNINVTAITYSESLGLFVAVGAGILTSTDGINWNRETVQISTSLQLKSVVYSEELNMFVAVGFYDTILTSTDGINWSNMSSALSVDLMLYSVTYSDTLNMFVAVGQYRTGNNAGGIVTSADGINWNFLQNQTFSYILYSVTYSDTLGLFVAVGESGQIISSSDGVNWVDRSQSDFSKLLFDVAYIDDYSLFIAVGNNCILTSTDGINWGQININRTYYSIAYSEEIGKVVIVGSVGGKATSIDGINWTYYNIDYYDSYNNIYYLEKLKLFVAIGTSRILISSDGINWSESFRLANVFMQGSSCIYSSTQDIYIFFGTLHIITTKDCVNWTDNNTEWVFTDVTYSNRINLYLATSNSGKILSSTDGINWNLVFSSSYPKLNAIDYSEKLNLFVAVGYNGGTLISSDGVSWTENTIENGTYYDVYYSTELDRFIVVGYANYNSKIISSSDGLNWNEELSIHKDPLLKITYSKELNVFVVVGNAIILTSSDGENWSEENNIPMLPLRSITYSPILNFFIAVGSESTFLKSDIELLESKIQNINPYSDMNLNLQLGINKFRLTKDSGNIRCRIKYRQKYIGV